MKTLLSTLFWCCYIVGYSQSDLQSGFLINNAGDTLKCQISQSSIEYPFDEIEVLLPGATAVRSYSVNESLGFGIGDVTYEALSTNLNLTKFESSSSKWEVKSDFKLFIKLLTSGEIDLYSSKNLQGEPIFFIRELNNEVAQLIYHSYYKPNGELVLNDNFINQLYFLTKEKKLALTSLSYDEPSLKRFIKRYNNLSEKEPRPKLARYRINTGLTYFKPHIVSGVVSTVAFESSISPNLGIEMVSPIGKSSTFFNLGLNYNFYKTTKTSGNIYSHVGSFSAHNLFLYAGLKKYFLNTQKVKPYLTGSFGINEYFWGNTFLVDGTKVRMRGAQLLNKDFLLRAHSVKWFAGAGVQLSKKIELEMKFEKIERYNERSDNGGRSSLTGINLSVFYTLK